MTVLFSTAPGRRAAFQMLVTLFGALFLFSCLQTASAESMDLPPYQKDRVWFNWYRPGHENSTLTLNSSSTHPRSLREAYEPVTRSISHPRTVGEAQIQKFVEYLSDMRGSQVQPPSVALDTLQSTIRRRLSHRRDQRISVNFVQMGGSNGDVAVITSVLQEMLRQSNLFNVRHAVISPQTYRTFFPDNLRDHFRRDNQGWETRSSSDNERFAAKVVEVMAEEPDLLITGHGALLRHLWRNSLDDQTYTRLANAVRPTSRRVTIDTTVLYHPSLSPQLWSLQDVSPWNIRLYMQEPTIWNNPNPLSIGAPMTGKATGISGSARPGGKSGPVYDWLRRQGPRSIMYLGIGGALRQNDKSGVTPLFREYIDAALEAKTTWSFIILHNFRRDDTTTWPRETHSGRVFHLFYGEAALIDLFKEVDMVVSHGGVGTLTDAIGAGIPQIVIPVPEISPDQEYFASNIEHSMGIGVGLPPIVTRQLAGIGTKYDVRLLIQGVNRVKKYYKDFSAATRRYRTELERNDSLRNNMEVIVRAMDGHFTRKYRASKKRGVTPMALHRRDIEKVAERAMIAVTA
jgi:hypothetical protein